MNEEAGAWYIINGDYNGDAVRIYFLFCVIFALFFLSACPQPTNNDEDNPDCHEPVFLVDFQEIEISYQFSGSISISIHSPTPGASVYYTLDGSDPTKSDYLYTTTIPVEESTVLKARAFKDGYDPSTIASIDLTASVIAFSPLPGAHVISINEGSDSRNLEISLTGPAGAAIRYTLDGSEPTELSPPYSAPLVLSQDTTIKARAFLPGENPSEVAQGAYSLRYSFWAYNWTTNNSYVTYARRKSTGIHSIIYVQEGMTVPDDFLVYCDTEFEKMYSLVEAKFSQVGDVDGDGKVSLLILDILDGATETSGYVAGYFDPINTLEYPDSNRADMLYLDWNPGGLYLDGFVSTIIHELQHLANWNNTFILESGKQQDTWVNEGLSTAAEYLYAGEHLSDRIDYYNRQPEYNGGTDTIKFGENFLSWGRHYPFSDILAAYSTVYLFMQWLRIQDPDAEGVYKEIIDAPYYDAQAVVAAVSDWDPVPDWPTLLRTWYLANLLDLPDSVYGYKNELIGPLSLTPRVLASQQNSSLRLYPGEGVYLAMSSPYAPSASTYIGYAGFVDATDPLVDSVSPHLGDFLLAYNHNKDDSASYLQTAPLPQVSIPGFPLLTSVPRNYISKSTSRLRIDSISPRGMGALFASPSDYDLREYQQLSTEFPEWPR